MFSLKSYCEYHKIDYYINVLKNTNIIDYIKLYPLMLRKYYMIKYKKDNKNIHYLLELMRITNIYDLNTIKKINLTIWGTSIMYVHDRRFTEEFIDKYIDINIPICNKYLSINYIFNRKSSTFGCIGDRKEFTLDNKMIINESIVGYVYYNPNVTIEILEQILTKYVNQKYLLLSSFLQNDNCTKEYILNNDYNNDLIMCSNIGNKKYINSIQDIIDIYNYINPKNKEQYIHNNIIYFILCNKNFVFNKKDKRYYDILYNFKINIKDTYQRYYYEKINYINIRISKIFE